MTVQGLSQFIRQHFPPFPCGSWGTSSSPKQNLLHVECWCHWLLSSGHWGHQWGYCHWPDLGSRQCPWGTFFALPGGLCYTRFPVLGTLALSGCGKLLIPRGWQHICREGPPQGCIFGILDAFFREVGVQWLVWVLEPCEYEFWILHQPCYLGPTSDLLCATVPVLQSMKITYLTVVWQVLVSYNNNHWHLYCCQELLMCKVFYTY
jgi:hypothetical protein